MIPQLLSMLKTTTVTEMKQEPPRDRLLTRGFVTADEERREVVTNQLALMLETTTMWVGTCVSHNHLTEKHDARNDQDNLDIKKPSKV